VLLVFGAPCQLLLLAGPEHGRTIPLAVIETIRATSFWTSAGGELSIESHARPIFLVTHSCEIVARTNIFCSAEKACAGSCYLLQAIDAERIALADNERTPAIFLRRYAPAAQ
jgi:hypothetical protein